MLAALQAAGDDLFALFVDTGREVLKSGAIAATNRTTRRGCV
jgi:hypothetical protein